MYFPNIYVGYFETRQDSKYVIYLQNQYALNDIDQELIKVLETNIAVAFENLDLTQTVIGDPKRSHFYPGRDY